MSNRLLGDMPEFKEEIEGNIFLATEVKEIIEDEAELDFGLSEHGKDFTNTIDSILEEAQEEVKLNGEVLFTMIKYTPELAKKIWAAIEEEIEYNYTPDFKNAREVSESVIKHIDQFVKGNYGPSYKEIHKQLSAII